MQNKIIQIAKSKTRWGQKPKCHGGELFRQGVQRSAFIGVHRGRVLVIARPKNLKKIAGRDERPINADSRSTDAMMVSLRHYAGFDNTKGNYSFLKGISPYSAGVVASRGFAIEHARFQRALPLRAGFAAVDRHLKALGGLAGAVRNRAVLAASVQLSGFADFNAGYVDILQSWEILQDGLNPVARTQRCAEVDPPSEPQLYGFSYTVASERSAITFVVAGAGELPEGSPRSARCDPPREGFRDALAAKVGSSWDWMNPAYTNWARIGRCHHNDVYTVHDIKPCSRKKSCPGSARQKQARKITWHYARPPHR